MPNSYFKGIKSILSAQSSEKVKASVRKFVPDAQKVYGVKMPVINELAKKYEEGGFELVELLWMSGYFEDRLLAAKMLGRIAKKDPAKTLRLIEKFSKDVSDWAICDTLGMQSPKRLVNTHAKQIFAIANHLVRSKNFWQRRLALVLCEWYTRDKKCHPKINKLLSIVKNDEEYYVKKAVVWIKKNFHKGK